MNWGRLVGLGIASVIVIVATKLNPVWANEKQQVPKTIQKPIELVEIPESDWWPMAERQWARVLTMSGGKALVSIEITRSTEVFFKVTRPCGTSSETSVLMWKAGSSTGYTLDCDKKSLESLSPPFVEAVIGDLPREISYLLRWTRTHPKGSNSRML